MLSFKFARNLTDNLTTPSIIHKFAEVKFHREPVYASEADGKPRATKGNPQKKLLSARIWLLGGRPALSKKKKREETASRIIWKETLENCCSSLLRCAFFSPFFSALSLYFRRFLPSSHTHTTCSLTFLNATLLSEVPYRRLRRSMKEGLWFSAWRGLYMKNA